MMARGSGSGLFNLHNQAVIRAEYQGQQGPGFTVEFLSKNAVINLEKSLAGGVLAMHEAAIEAIVATTDDIKQKLRRYLDSHFTGSALTGNNHRRASNAMVQSVYFNEIKGRPGFASLIYSKWGKGSGPSSFVDFLLLHVRGGTIAPKKSNWLRIPNRGEAGALFGQSGNFLMSDSSIFFVKSKDDPNKLYQLRYYRTTGRTKLLATLVKSLTVEPSLAAIDVIAAQRGAIFDKYFDAAWARKASAAGVR